MTREGALLVMVGVAVVLLALIVWAWRRRLKRDAQPIVETGELSADAVVRGVFAGFYVATTRHDQPLERIAAPGLAYRSRASITIADEGLALDLPGALLLIRRERLIGTDLSTVAIDRVVERDGLTRVTWRALDDTVVDSYFRPQDASARALTDAIAGILPTPMGTDA